MRDGQRSELKRHDAEGTRTRYRCESKTQTIQKRVQGFFGEESKRVAWGKKTTNMEGSITPIVYAPFVVGMAVSIGRVAFVRYVVSVVVTTGPTANAPFVGSEEENMPRLVNAQPAESAVNAPAVHLPFALPCMY